ncbi:MAG: hypothetical protein ACJAYX_002140 [Planctomycetota bacterium]|jgi:hypothetical protein
MFRWQALELTANATNGLIAISNAHDLYQD